MTGGPGLAPFETWVSASPLVHPNRPFHVTKTNYSRVSNSARPGAPRLGGLFRQMRVTR